MPEVRIEEQPDKYIGQVPRFTLPKEFSNEPKEAPVVETPKEAPAPAEAKPVVEAKTEVVEPEKIEPETTEKDQAQPGAKKPESGETRRMFRAIRKEQEAVARAQALEREVAELKSRQTPKAPDTAPRMEDFTDVQEYAKAFAAHETQKTLRERETATQKAAFESHQARLSAGWEAQVLKAVEKYDDFDEVVGELKPGKSPWGDALMLSENGADVAHYLGKHTKEAERIFALPAASQFMEIGKLSYKLSVVPEPLKKPSKAPLPITPVGPGGAVPSGEIRADQPYEEYRKIGNKMFRGR